ncbi:TauD/TfdA dioxygenase family protein [Methylobacterium sp. J-070]|uniref:TauD/TfdA dioxygenase family protein n=1 Tax=Methylobacterium sp. J-070 TaxID=2836650 RepID=UPI001FBA31F7|nr:TauD/TfdA family dioxygenase [Methylobacterium sp. J-070]MCJ2051785.1 TauD/TfdA family dioxygenase [Methylobacterium sp. J-070]
MGVNVEPLGYALGAAVTGLDLSREVNAADMAAVHAAWLKHLVLVFPGQNLTPEQHMRFSRNFGRLDQHASQPRNYLDPEHPELLMITNKPIAGKPSDTRNTGRNWHTDLTFTLRPAKGALLLCREKPPVGGDTMWANLYLAYEMLSPRMRDFVEGLEAVHDASLIKNIEQRDPEKVAELKRLNPPVVHPVVRTHPETGRKSLLIGQRIRRFVGMSDEESDAILHFLNEHAMAPEFVYRHRWTVGDLVLWDNRCTQHIALPDFDPSQYRHMVRCSLEGEEVGRLYEVAQNDNPDALARAVAAMA